jgi:hypothetical protein
MQTIRLEITLGGPDNYEVDVKGMAREEGLVWGDLGEKKYADDSSDGEDGSDAEEGADGGAKEDKDGKDKDKDKKDADGDVEMDADGVLKLTFLHTRALTTTHDAETQADKKSQVQEKVQGYRRVLRHHRPVHRRLGACDRRAHVFCSNQAERLLCQQRRGRARAGQVRVALFTPSYVFIYFIAGHPKSPSPRRRPARHSR